MHLLNTSVHFPGLPLIVVAEGEFHLLYFSRSEVHLLWDEEATGFPLVQCFEEFIRRLIDADANKFTYRQFIHPHGD